MSLFHTTHFSSLGTMSWDAYLVLWQSTHTYTPLLAYSCSLLQVTSHCYQTPKEYTNPFLPLNSRASCRHSRAPSVVVSSLTLVISPGAQVRVCSGSCENLHEGLLCAHTTLLSNLCQSFSFLPDAGHSISM